MQNFDDATPLTMRAYQQIAHDYAERHTPVRTPPAWGIYLQNFSEQIRANPHYQADPALLVLDIGCGPGRDSLSLAQIGFNVIAADLSQAMLDEARARCKGQQGAERISFRQMDMRRLELPDASCAGIWSSASFLHIPKRENQAVIAEWLRVLVPGGALHLTVKESDGGADERYEEAPDSGAPRFFARYHGSELWALLESAGLEVVEIRTDIDRRFEHRPRWLAALATKGRLRDGEIRPLLTS